MQRAHSILSQLEEETKTHEFLKTGFNRLDDKLNGGFLKKELIVIGANSGIGKSYIAAQIFYNIAQQGFNCAYFSLEIANAMILSRLIGMEADIMPTRIQYELLTPQEYESKIQATTKITSQEDFMAFYDDVYTYNQIVEEIKENKFDFVVIDFLQNLENGMPDEYARLSKITKDLQKIAKELNCCIVLISQQSNSAAREGSQTSSLEYKGSGAIKHAADLGFIIERSDYIEGQSFQDIKLVLKKNRRGQDDLAFNLKFCFPGGKIKEV